MDVMSGVNATNASQNIYQSTKNVTPADVQKWINDAVKISPDSPVVNSGLNQAATKAGYDPDKVTFNVKQGSKGEFIVNINSSYGQNLSPEMMMAIVSTVNSKTRSSVLNITRNTFELPKSVTSKKLPVK